ncbi:hypothetical protein [Bradyrhizobium sp. USDA 4506]
MREQSTAAVGQTSAAQFACHNLTAALQDERKIISLGGLDETKSTQGGVPIAGDLDFKFLELRTRAPRLHLRSAEPLLARPKTTP